MTFPTARRRIAAAMIVGALATVAVSALATPAAATTAPIFAVPDKTLVSATSVSNSDPKGVTVTCPSGTRVLGSGFDFAGAPGDLVLESLVPTASTVTAYGYEAVSGTAASWTIRAWAICGNPHGSSTTVSRTSALDSNNKLVEVTCPAGQKVSGTGVELTGARGNVLVDELIPTADKVSASTFERDLGFGGNYRVTVYATCISPLAGMQVVSAVDTGTTLEKNVVVSCAAGKQALGAGFDIEFGAGDPIVDDLILSSTSAQVWASDESQVSAPDGGWNLRSYAVCYTAVV